MHHILVQGELHTLVLEEPHNLEQVGRHNQLVGLHRELLLEAGHRAEQQELLHSHQVEQGLRLDNPRLVPQDNLAVVGSLVAVG